MKLLVNLTLLLSFLLVFGIGCQQDTGSSLADLLSKDPIIADWRFMMENGEDITKENVIEMLAVDRNKEKRWDCELRSVLKHPEQKFSEYFELGLDKSRLWSYRKSAGQETYELTSPNYTWTDLGPRHFKEEGGSSCGTNVTTYLRRYEDKLVQERIGTFRNEYCEFRWKETLEPVMGGYTGRTRLGFERTTTLSYTLCQLVQPDYKKIGFSTKELQESLVELSDTTPKAYSEFYKALSSKVDELPLKVGRSAANTNYKARAYLLMAIEPLVTGFDSDYFKERVHASYKESLKELTEELEIESKEDLRSSIKIVGIRLDLSIEALKALKRSVNNEQAQELNEFLSELGHLKASLNADPRSYNEVSEELSGVIESYENLLLEMATIWRSQNFVQLVQSVK